MLSEEPPLRLCWKSGNTHGAEMKGLKYTMCWSGEKLCLPRLARIGTFAASSFHDLLSETSALETQFHLDSQD